jgi:two-component system, OmpR family, alkaline phosphatase synthesis response regulator PhoP
MQKILVIDDDPVIARLVKLMLGLENYEVITAANVAEALTAMETSKPDVICCDLMMPDVSGLDFLEQRQTMPQIALIPVIVISGVGKQSWFERAYELDAAICLAKPFNAPQLIEAIKQVTETERNSR